MENYSSETYGDRVATIYDEWYADLDASALGVLRELAAGGAALELGIGTGRIALPLQQSGIEVHGIDASQAMIDRLRAKPGGDQIPITLGDFGEVAVEGQFSLVYVVFNTFFGLLTQEDQIRCFANVAQHLTPDGVFLMEVFVPDFTRFSYRQTVRAVSVEAGEAHLEVSRLDPVSQQVSGQHVVLTEEGVRLYPLKLRFAWPAELDLMARLAGLRLWRRWENWQRAPYSADSTKHISVYKQAR